MPVPIKGKQYTTCAERMELLRQSEKTFEIMSSEPVQIGDRVVWRMTAIIDGNQFIGSAECHLNAKPGSADATDPFACGETSALARLLGFAGFGAEISIASADEIVRNDTSVSGNATLDQAPPSAQQLDSLKKLALHLGEKIQKPKTYQEAKKMIDELTTAYNEMTARGRAS